MALAPRDLIQRDLKQVVEPIGREQLVADPLDDPPDRLPIDPHQPTGRGPIGLGHQPGDQVLEVPGEAGAVPGERHALHVHTVLGTAQPSKPRVNLQSPDPEIQVPPDRVVVLLALPMRRRVRALRALKTTALERDRDHHPVGLEAHRPDPDPRQVQQAVECRGDAHRRRPPVRWLQTPRTYGLNLCASQADPARSEERAQTRAKPRRATFQSPPIIHGASKILPAGVSARLA